MGVSRVVVTRGGGIFWEGGVYSGRLIYRCLKRVGYILGGRGKLWECRI